jgi:PRTRC genetic system ThiF family protein
MLEINTERPYRVLVKWQERKEIIISLVGVGGTGSALAIDLARLCYHAQQMGRDVQLQLIDGDRVEASNVGRQQFSEWEIGCNKAEAMGKRLSMWLGIDVMGTAEYLKASNLPLWKEGQYHSPNRLIVGAVDNYRARRAIANAMDKLGTWWVDAGNDDASGQVLIGNCRAGRHVEVDNHFGLVSGLPLPSLQMPALLDKPAIRKRQMDCATGMATGEQGLFVNRLMATWAARAVEDLVLRQEINYMAVYASLMPPAAESRLITWTRLQKFKDQLKFSEKMYEEEE